MKGLVNMIYLTIAASMLIYAVPHLQIGQEWSLKTVFTLVWLLLALVVIASHLRGILKVDQEVKLEVKPVKQMKRKSDFG
jgi:hypothetical protein